MWCTWPQTSPSPFPILPHPRVKVLKFGEQRKLLISPGLLSDAPAQSSLLKSEPADTPKGSNGKSGRLGRASCPGCTPIFCLSFDSRLPILYRDLCSQGRSGKSWSTPCFRRENYPRGTWTLNRGPATEASAHAGPRWEGDGAGVGAGPPERLLQLQREYLPHPHVPTCPEPCLCWRMLLRPPSLRPVPRGDWLQG